MHALDGVHLLAFAVASEDGRSELRLSEAQMSRLVAELSGKPVVRSVEVNESAASSSAPATTRPDVSGPDDTDDVRRELTQRRDGPFAEALKAPLSAEQVPLVLTLAAYDMAPPMTKPLPKTDDVGEIVGAAMPALMASLNKLSVLDATAEADWMRLFEEAKIRKVLSSPAPLKIGSGRWHFRKIDEGWYELRFQETRLRPPF
jgi:hypothetical protein